jgi:transposase
MTVHKFIRKLLRLKDLSVTDFEFRFRDRELCLWVKPHKNGCLCPECKHRGRILRTMEHRVWHDIPICGWSISFHYCPREILCRRHGRVQELIPWAEVYARVTYRFEYGMLLYCQLMP